jgi:hypothetical protein
MLRTRGDSMTSDDLLLLSETFLLTFPARAPFARLSPAVARELWVQWGMVLAGAAFFVLFAIARSLVLRQDVCLETQLLGLWLFLIPLAQFAVHAASARLLPARTGHFDHGNREPGAARVSGASVRGGPRCAQPVRDVGHGSSETFLLGAIPRLPPPGQAD